MQLLSCPDQESLLAFITVASELPLLRRAHMRTHIFACKPCREKMEALKSTWEAYFAPEPEIAPSLMRIYGKLQQDETLILKGWKLSHPVRHRPLPQRLVREGWLFRGGIALGGVGLAGWLVLSQLADNTAAGDRVAATSQMKMPLAQIRIQDKNSVQVRYVQPELLDSVEFETTSEK